MFDSYFAAPTGLTRRQFVVLNGGLSLTLLFSSLPSTHQNYQNAGPNCSASLATFKTKLAHGFKKVLYLPSRLRLALNNLKATAIKKEQYPLVLNFIDELTYLVKNDIINEDQATQLIKNSKIELLQNFYRDSQGKITFKLIEAARINEQIDLLETKLRAQTKLEDEYIESALEEIRRISIVFDQKTFEKGMLRIEDSLIQAFSHRSPENAELFLRFTNYVSQQGELEFLAGLRAIDHIFTEDLSKASFPTKRSKKVLKRFRKIDERLKKSFHLFYVEAYKEARLKGLSPQEANEKARRIARNKNKRKEELEFSCRTKKLTPNKITAAKSITKFGMTLGISSSILFYTTTYWSEDKSSIDWYGKLGFELTEAIVLTYVRIKILASGNKSMELFLRSYMGNGTFAKINQTYAADSVLKILSAETYSALFGVSVDEARQEIKELEKNVDVDEEIKTLLSYLEKSNYAHRFQEEVLRLQEQNYLLSEEEWADQDIQDLLLHAITTKEYEDTKGDWIQTGDRGKDRYWYDRAWSLNSTPRGFLLANYIYGSLCRGLDTPFGAYSKATLLSISDRVIFDPLYFTLRKKAIGQ